MKKDSYLGFILWLIVYIVVTFSVSIFTENVSYVILWMENSTFIMVTVLMYIIYKTRNIHWFSGIDKDEVRKYTDKQIDAYTKSHFDLFSKSTLLVLAYSLIGYVLNFPFWIHLFVFIFGLIGVIVYSRHIKLGES